MSQLHRTVFISTTALAVIVITRYLVFLQGQEDPAVPQQFLFEHAVVLMLGVGAVYGVVLILRPRPTSERLLLLAFVALMIVAVATTARRSGTLVLMVALFVMIAMLLFRKPMVTIWISSLVLAAAALYVGAYWNQQYGAAAQPARAIRSQLDPSLRDNRSDTYRDIERSNVLRTIRSAGPTFGIGLGNSYARFIPVPVLDWWPFQFVTPHDNILWIWLKFGIVGVGVLLGVWVLALRRCLVAFFSAPKDGPIPIVPLAVAASLAMFFAFARIDVLLVSPRGAIPLAVLLALAFTLPDPRSVDDGSLAGGAP